MRPTLLYIPSTLKWVMLALVSTFLIACNDHGRGPILGTDGNVALSPTVTAVTPLPDATNVTVINPSITARFSEPVNALTASNFTVTCASPCTSPTGTVSMNADNTVATFTVTSPAVLNDSTRYTATIVTATSRRTGLTLAQPYVWQFTTGVLPDTTRPRVLSTIPVTESPGPTPNVVVDTRISAEFSKEMLAATINGTSFTVTCEAPCVNPEGSVTYDSASRTAEFTATENLDWDTVYTATIDSSVTDLAGNELAGNQGDATTASDYIWQFETGLMPDTTRPRVTVTKPATTIPGPTPNVPANTAITAEFSKEMLASTINATSFTVTCEAPCVNPVGSVTYDAPSKTAEFTTTEDLDWETVYTATIDSSVTDLAGNELAGNQGNATTASDYIWQFETALTPDTTRPRVVVTEPATTSPGPTPNVPANTAITAVFSEDMLASTINDTSFTLTCETPCISPPGAVSYVTSSKSAVFTPQENLEEGTTYTATITSDATDLAGNRLAGNQGPVTSASDYIWTFTTVEPVPEDNIFVESTDPIDGGFLAVCPNASINATFEIPSGVRLNPMTVNNMTFLVVENNEPTNTVMAESIMVDEETGRIITFIPQEQLAENVIYRATIKGGPDGVKDLIIPGNEMLEDYEWTFTTEAPTESCLLPPDLGTAAPFGTFGGSAGVTNRGLLTIVNGDLGTTGTSTIVTGFVSEPGCEYTITPLNEGQVNGKIFTAPPPPTVECPQDGTAETEAVAIQARLDAEAAFIALSPANMPGGQDPGNDNLGSLTLIPGIYTAQSGSFSIQGGDLTLDAQGNQNAVWVFQMATTLTVGGPGADFPQSVILINGAQAKNVFWQVGSAATINAAGGGFMKGTIIAQDGVSISTAGNVNIVTLDGRALSLTASVTMVNTVINVPAE
ncbi:Ig-like domain-containing protein [Aliidiomarina indica]|uniref:Ig-like domain-containing protein n=1 Tax=Aliidiomarina indica TaxID=2749147 RepID=UPI00188E0062|nr:Ig-like domain-containing protein [Aliidiomarina indica]